MSNALVPQTMDDALRLATAMSRGKMVPEHLQGSVGDCLMIVEQAMRWGMSPFAVAQCSASIKGKLMFEGKLVAAAVETSGAIVGGFDYQFSGAGDDRKVTVAATRRGEQEPRTVEVTLRDARTGNDIWKRQPDQQLIYAGNRIWARRWAPAVILGVYSPDEIDDEPPARPAITDQSNMIDGTATETETPEAATQTHHRTWRDLVKGIEAAAMDAEDEAAVAALGQTKDVSLVYAQAGKATQAEVGAILATAMARVRGETGDPI